MNFINPIPEQKKQEINRWFLHTVIISSLTAIALIGYTALQIKQLSALRQTKQKLEQQTASFDTTTEQLNTIKKEQQELQTKLEKVAKNSASVKKVYEQLETVSNIIPNDLYIQDFSVGDTGSLVMTGYGASTESINKFVAQLQQTPIFAKAQLLLLQTQKGNDKSLPFNFKITA